LIDLVRRRPIDYDQDAAHWTYKLFNYERQRGPQRRLTVGAHRPMAGGPVGPVRHWWFVQFTAQRVGGVYTRTFAAFLNK